MMYIPEFWAGVLSTILVEVVSIITFAIIQYIKEHRRKK